MDYIIKYGWLSLIIAMTGDLFVSGALSIFYKEYSSTKMSISALGNPSSPVRRPFNIWMVLEGILFLMSIPAVYKYYYPVSGGLTVTVVIFIAVFGHSFVQERREFDGRYRYCMFCNLNGFLRLVCDG